MKVLVVDDSKTMRSIQRNILLQLGYAEVEEACDGQDAMSKVEAFKPDLILLDWNMPRMDGLAFLEAYRAGSHETPVIMVTTEAERPRVIEAIKAGVNNYVVKPFTPEILSRRIEETIEKSSTS
ncbi:MAG: response regulator [Planctomycetota bacterium]|jgi:two-component system chemotaxis response regulator CheY